MAIKNISLLAALILSGCAVFEPFDDMVSPDKQAQDTGLSQNINDGSPFASSVSFQKQFQQNERATVAELKELLLKQSDQKSNAFNKEHDINYYVRGLMQDLVANLQYVNSTTPVAVVSFVMLDSNYNDSNLLGIQIAESLIHEVHKFGIPVIDFKTTGYIRVTEKGDFAFSKDYEDFTGDMPARYIVGGTMLKHTDGYLINARIVGVKSQAVVASAQSFIPNSVSEPILMMSAMPNSRVSNETVELGSVAFPMDKVADNSSSNKVSLIQE